MRVSGQRLLLLLLLEDLVPIPGLFDCNLYKCKRYLPNFSSQRMASSNHQSETLITAITKKPTFWGGSYTAALCNQDCGSRFTESRSSKASWNHDVSRDSTANSTAIHEAHAVRLAHYPSSPSASHHTVPGV